MTHNIANLFDNDNHCANNNDSCYFVLSERIRLFTSTVDPELPDGDYILTDTGRFETKQKRKTGLFKDNNSRHVKGYFHLPSQQRIVIAFVSRMNRVKRPGEKLKRHLGAGLVEVGLHKATSYTKQNRREIVRASESALIPFRNYVKQFMHCDNTKESEHRVVFHSFRRHFKVFVEPVAEREKEEVGDEYDIE